MSKRSSSAPAGSRRGTWLRALGTLIALALLAYLLDQHWADISETATRIDPWRLAGAMLLMIISRFAVSGRWHVLLHSGGVKIRASQSIRLTFAGLFAGNFLPTTVGGDVARLGGAILLGFDGAVSAASLVADRIIGLLGMAFAVPLGLQKIVQNGGLSLFGLAPVAFAASNPLSRFWLWSVRMAKRLLTVLRMWLNQPKALAASLGFTFIHMACLFSSMYILLEGMHEPLPFLTIAGLWSLVYVITLLPFTINGLGLQEVTTTYAFNHFGGLSAPNSLVLAILVRTLFLLASLPGALFLSDVLPGVSKAQPFLNKLRGAKE